MSLKLGTQDIAGISQNTKYNAHHLLDFKWTDCIMNDVSWLRADTFSWQSGDVYTSAYNHLVQDIQGITSETETIGSYTVTFYRATDGHKICLADQEQTVLNIYNETGIAWYYILDTTNTQFKLPRTKYGFEGLRGNVGDKIDESLPNITGNFTTYGGNISSASGAFQRGTAQGNVGAYTSGSMPAHVYSNASLSSSTYQDNASVQERATQMYLYFYVGDYSQTAIEQTAGLNAELFNGKLDLNASNLSSQGMSYVAELGMPSDTYIDLTLGASGSTYTATANGWFNIVMSIGSNNYLYIDNMDVSTSVINGKALYGLYANSNLIWNIAYSIPVRKGQIISIVYNGTVQSFRFIYAVGSESEAS